MFRKDRASAGNTQSGKHLGRPRAIRKRATWFVDTQLQLAVDLVSIEQSPSSSHAVGIDPTADSFWKVSLFGAANGKSKKRDAEMALAAEPSDGNRWEHGIVVSYAGEPILVSGIVKNDVGLMMM